MTTKEHPAITAQKHLTRIATIYPDLQKALGRGNTTNNNDKISGSKTPPLPIRLNVSETITTTHQFAMHLADAIYLETGQQLQLMDADIFTETARNYIGVFAPHDDDEAHAFVKECRQLEARITSVTYPHGVKWIDVPNRVNKDAKRRDPMPCAEPECNGHYRMRISPDGDWYVNIADPATWPPLTCKKNETHIVTGIELSRATAYARMNNTTCIEELRKWRAA